MAWKEMERKFEELKDEIQVLQDENEDLKSMIGGGEDFDDDNSEAVERLVSDIKSQRGSFLSQGSFVSNIV